MKAQDLLSSYSAWTQFTMARPRRGTDAASEFPSARDTNALRPDAVCWCIDGALIKCYGHETDAYFLAKRKVTRVLEKWWLEGKASFKETVGHLNIWSFNDTLPDTPTSHALVLELLREADV